MRPSNRLGSSYTVTLARGAAASLLALAAAACSGTTVPSSGPLGSSDAGASVANGSGGSGSGSGGTGSGTGAGDTGGTGTGTGGTTGGACPCAVESYCDLATNTCKAGCTEPSQCAKGRTCDTATRTCKDVCTGPQCGAAACPVPPPSGTNTCNGIVPSSATVNVTCKTGTAPVAAGGVVKDGAYTLTAIEIWNDSASCTGTGNGTWYICGSTWALANEQTLGSVTGLTATATQSNATTMSLSVTCPTGQTTPDLLQYTATGSTLQVFNTVGTGVEIDYFALE